MRSRALRPNRDGRPEPRTRRVLVRLATALLVTAMLAASCSGDGDGDRSASPSGRTDPPGGEVEVTAGDFAPGDCPGQVLVAPPTTARCGVLIVPERHGEPDGPTVRLPVAILEPPEDLSNTDPVVYLDGGPGSDGVGMAPRLSELPLAGTRSVVVVGQRGSPLASPNLDCPETEQVARAQYDEELGTPEAVAEYQRAVRECFERVAADVDLDAFDTVAAADDLEAARLALGYEEWNLYGVSYGTRLALEVLRRHPGPVRSVVLDSALPPQVDRFAARLPNAWRAFGELAAACEADAACHRRHPDLLDRVEAQFERLEERPVDVTVAHPTTGVPTTVRWDGDRMARAAFSALYDPTLLALLPSLLAAFETGDLELATSTFLAVGDTTGGDIAEGLFLAVECREQAPFADRAAIRAQVAELPTWVLASVAGEEGLGECDRWEATPADSQIREPVTVEVPMLVLSGRFDPVTPPEWGAELVRANPGALFLSFPSSGHAVSMDPCARQVVGWFLDDPTAAPDTTCVADLPAGPEWVLVG